MTVDTSTLMRPHVHGTAEKSLVVCHETVSHDAAGLDDGDAVARYLAEKDYGIHGVIDREGHLWWANGLSDAIFYHAASGAGMVNTRGIGIELVSWPTGSNREQYARWLSRERQLAKLARVCEWQSHLHGFPLVYSDSSGPGVTTHWDVSHRWSVPGGHTDCWPRKKGGYFPVGRVVLAARAVRAARRAMRA